MRKVARKQKVERYRNACFLNNIFNPNVSAADAREVSRRVKHAHKS